MTALTKPKAIDLLRASKLHQTQLELMGEDIDLASFYLAFKVGDEGNDLNIIDAVADVDIKRTIEGASTIIATVIDNDLVLLQSGKLSSRQTIEIDGLFFTLVSVDISDDRVLTLTFEDREVNVLRRYNKPIKQSLKTSRANLSRAQFVLRMLKEVKELPPIPYVIPELNVVEPIAATKQVPTQASSLINKGYGIPKLNGLKVKKHDMTEEQRKNANTVLTVGFSRIAPLRPRPLLVMSIMAAIQESDIINLPYTFKNPNHRGVFQQDPRYWPASGDVGKDAAAFFDRLAAEYKKNPHRQYHYIIESIQGSGYPLLYAPHKQEAERIVTAFGVVDGSAASANAQWDVSLTISGDYEFYRGIPPSSASQRKKGKTGWGKESSWDAMGRLADEVQWRRFFVSGTFYFIADDDLFSAQPIATISPTTDGINTISGSYDENKRQATLTINCFMNRWAAPPGGVVQVQDFGPWDGRWLVNDVDRSAFSDRGTITLKKPLPRLPEPAGSNVGSGTSADQTWNLKDRPSDDPNEQFLVGVGLVQPVPAGFGNKIVQGWHETANLPGYPAADFGARAGSPVIAVEDGVITRLSGKNPILGPWDPILKEHGPFGWSIYLQGKSGTKYYYTHLATQNVVKDQTVREGEEIATIGNYAKWGGVDHVHLGVHPGPKNHPDIYDLMAAKKAAKP